jgi:hypothetical protein
MLKTLTLTAALAAPAAPAADSTPAPATDQDADAAAYQGQAGDTAVYIFTGDDVEGAVWKPTGENLRGPGTVRHESLLTLRNHFNNELVQLSLEL